jgi:hypothetical protein
MVARIERSEMREGPRHAPLPDFAPLNPGYTLCPLNVR